MKTLLTILLTAGIFVAILRSELTPWRLVHAVDLDNRSRIAVPAPPAADHGGDWMHNPNYRSALEKTTIVGVPEHARPREATPAPPSGRP